MNRRTFLAITTAALAAPLAAEAQQAGKVPRVGILSASSPSVSASQPNVQAFEEGLRSLGWTVGRNLVFERRYAERQLDRLPALAQDLVRLNVDVIVAFGPNTIRPARDATRTIPIVMTAVADPVGEGLVASLARPGGNITGVAAGAGSETIGKILEILKEVLPRASRVTILGDGRPISSGGTRTAAAAAQRLNLQVETSVVKDLPELEPAMDALSRQGVDAVFLPLRGFMFSNRTHVAALAVARRLPTFGTLRELPEAGGLLSYGQPLVELYRRAATFVDKILKGAKPADLPVEQAMKFELVINLKTAKALGLTIPPAVLLRADHVIE